MSLTYNALFFVTLAALLSPWLSERLFRGVIPAVVLEILLGFALGQHGLHIATSTVYVNFLATFGFSYLMFLSGIELDFDIIFERPQAGEIAPWLRGAGFFFVTFAISFGFAELLHAFGAIHNVLMLTLILSTTSLGIVTPALKEKGWIHAHFGQEVLLYALIADVLTLVIFTGYVTFHTTGNAFSILLVMVLLVFFGVLYRLLVAAKRWTWFAVVENTTSELGLRAAFALILAFLAFAQTLGTEVVVGAFLAGAIVSLLSERHSLLTKKLNSFGYGFLLPVFFVNVGMQFSLSSVAGSATFWIALVVLLLGMYLNKLLPAWYFMRKFPLRLRTAGGFLLGAQLSLTVAASQIAEHLGLLPVSMANGIILLAIITCLLSPAVFSRLLHRVPIPDNADDGRNRPSVLTIDTATLPDGWMVDQIEVRTKRWTNIPMRLMRLPHEVLFISILRDDERIVPRGHTRLMQFDVVQVMGDPDVIRRLQRQLSPRPDLPLQKST